MDASEKIDEAIIKKVLKSALKKATGYDTSEVVEEFVKDKNNETLVKRKVTKYHVPADISAVKFLLEICSNKSVNNYDNMTDDELDQEAIRLFQEYQNMTDKDMSKEIKKGENDDCS